MASIPGVEQIEVNGQLPQPLAVPSLVHVIGCASAGQTNKLKVFGRLADLQAEHGRGPAVELAAVQLQAGRQVSVTRVTTATAGTNTAVVKTGTGTSTVTVTGAPELAYGVVVEVVTGTASIATSGAQIRYTLNGGYKVSPVYSLRGANSFAIPDTNLTLNFGAGSLVEGDKYTFTSAAPQWNSAGLGAALDLLRTAKNIDSIQIAGTMSATDFGTVDSKLLGHQPYGKFYWGIVEWRTPNVGESVSDYNDAFETALGGKSSDLLAVAKGGYLTTSAVDGTEYIRTPLYGASAVITPESISENPSQPLGHNVSLVRLTDDDGNPVGQDALFDSTLANEALTFRTFAGRAGTFINLSRLWSGPDSSFRLIMARRTINRTHQIVDTVLVPRTNAKLFANADGTIREDEALDLEGDLSDELYNQLAGHISSLVVKVDRSINIVTTSQPEIDVWVQPVGYAERIKVRIALVAKVQVEN